jgi:hypothetical protein
MDSCQWIKQDGKECRNKATKSVQYCWRHPPNWPDPRPLNSDDAIEWLLQCLYGEGIAALEAGDYDMAIDRLGLIQRLDTQYRDSLERMSEARERRTNEQGKIRHQVPNWAYLAVLFGAVYAFLASLLENSFSLLLSISQDWALLLSPLYFLGTVIIVIWATRVVAKRSAGGVSEDD